MRNRTTTLTIALCGILVGGMVSASGTEPTSSVKTEVGTTDDLVQKAPFRVGMYRIIRSLTINILIEKKPGEVVYVKLRDQKGHVLFKDILSRRQQKYGRKFNFSQVPDGQYSVVISNGEQEVVKDIRLSTQHLYEMPARQLVAIN
jgi:hypothetical protein